MRRGQLFSATQTIDLRFASISYACCNNVLDFPPSRSVATPICLFRCPAPLCSSRYARESRELPMHFLIDNDRSPHMTRNERDNRARVGPILFLSSLIWARIKHFLKSIYGFPYEMIAVPRRRRSENGETNVSSLLLSSLSRTRSRTRSVNSFRSTDVTHS